MNVPNLVNGLFRSPPKHQRRDEIEHLAQYVKTHLKDPRWVATSRFISMNKRGLTWREEQDVHLYLWNAVRNHVRSHTRVA